MHVAEATATVLFVSCVPTPLWYVITVLLPCNFVFAESWGTHLSVHHMHFGAVVVVDAGKLQADVPPANDRHLLGAGRQVEHLIRDDGMLSAIDW